MIRLAASLAFVLLGAWASVAQTTFTVTTSADAFLATGSSNNPAGSDLTGRNFGGAGTLVVAPPASAKGEVQSVIRFSLSNAIPLFNSAYGTNAWRVSSVSLELTSNYGTAGVQPNNPIFDVISGGKFVIEWLADNSWLEGNGTPSFLSSDGVTYDDLSALLSNPHELLSTNTYIPPGNDVHVIYQLPLRSNLVANITAGTELSLLFYAADNQIYYLFNSWFYGRGNEPLIHVTATPLLLITSGFFTNQAFHLSGLGQPNTEYQLQARTNLLTSTAWQTLATTSADSIGAIQFDDLTATNHPQRFYRFAR